MASQPLDISASALEIAGINLTMALINRLSSAGIIDFEQSKSIYRSAIKQCAAGGTDVNHEAAQVLQAALDSMRLVDRPPE